MLAYGGKAAAHHGEIRADLEREGTPIGVNDLHIAGHARSEGLTLVSNNLREFERVDALRQVNWAWIKIAGSIAKTVVTADFKFFFALFFHHRIFNDLALTGLRAVYCTQKSKFGWYNEFWNVSEYPETEGTVLERDNGIKIFYPSTSSNCSALAILSLRFIEILTDGYEMPSFFI